MTWYFLTFSNNVHVCIILHKVLFMHTFKKLQLIIIGISVYCNSSNVDKCKVFLLHCKIMTWLPIFTAHSMTISKFCSCSALHNTVVSKFLLLWTPQFCPNINTAPWCKNFKVHSLTVELYRNHNTFQWLQWLQRLHTYMS